MTNSLLNTPIETTLLNVWRRIDPAARSAIFVAMLVSALAFGFEATNLSLHHDDVNQIFIEDTILGHYLGRFGVGWLYYYTQGSHFMPFVQMAVGIVAMAGYGVLVGWLWGARKTSDLSLVACIVCVFPYMANVYQYNTSMATYTLAHLWAAGAVAISVQRGSRWLPVAVLLFVAAFSVYQGVAANALTIFLGWWLTRLLLNQADTNDKNPILAAIGRAALAGIAAGALYYWAVSFMTIEFDAYQSAEKALKPGAGIDLKRAVPIVLHGTRTFLLWPEVYFPGFLKGIQALFVVVASIVCLRLPTSWSKRFGALAILGLAIMSPRCLQLLHAEGHFHELTLTAYALVVALTVVIVRRMQTTLLPSAAWLGAVILIGGYVVQCAWISTVGYLNTLAHLSTMTQVLSRLRAIPGTNWDGKTILVVGSYEMPRKYPYARTTGIASEYMRAQHMGRMAALLRDEANIISPSTADPRVMEFSKTLSQWPSPSSVGVFEGIGVVVMSKSQ